MYKKILKGGVLGAFIGLFIGSFFSIGNLSFTGNVISDNPVSTTFIMLFIFGLMVFCAIIGAIIFSVFNFD